MTPWEDSLIAHPAAGRRRDEGQKASSRGVAPLLLEARRVERHHSGPVRRECRMIVPKDHAANAIRKSLEKIVCPPPGAPMSATSVAFELLRQVASTPPWPSGITAPPPSPPEFVLESRLTNPTPPSGDTRINDRFELPVLNS